MKVKATGVYRPEAPDVDLSMCGILEYSGGRMAVFDSSFVMEDRQMVEIVGTGGRIIINRPWRPDRAEVAIVVQNGGAGGGSSFLLAIPTSEVEHFSSCIRTGQSPSSQGVRHGCGGSYGSMSLIRLFWRMRSPQSVISPNREGKPA